MLDLPEPTSHLRPAARPLQDRDAVSVWMKVCLFFFAFPLFVPAAGGTVVYPFLIYGLVVVLDRQWDRKALIKGFVVFCLVLFAIMANASAAIRMLSFLLALVFVAEIAASQANVRLLLKLMRWHSYIIIVQWLLVVVGIEIDFSKVLRAIYGPLLPPTGNHIDYNAFSQIDIFFPRVAGLNREPAFASIFFLAVAYLAWLHNDGKSMRIFVAAIAVSLSKVVFPIVLAYFIASIGIRRIVRPRVWSRFFNVLMFVAAFGTVLVLAWTNLELVQISLALDNSFFHRFIGVDSMLEHPELFAFFGDSWQQLAGLPEFANYEFADNARAFLDGSVVPKLLVDFGYIYTGIFIVILSLVARGGLSMVALCLTGLFLNFLSVAPATVLTFALMTGAFFKALPAPVKAPRRRRRRRMASIGVQPMAPEQ